MTNQKRQNIQARISGDKIIKIINQAKAQRKNPSVSEISAKRRKGLTDESCQERKHKLQELKKQDTEAEATG